MDRSIVLNYETWKNPRLQSELIGLLHALTLFIEHLQISLIKFQIQTKLFTANWRIAYQ
jgi:hypothetical protein